MEPKIGVVAASPSFGKLWPSLADELGAACEVVADVAELGPLAAYCAVIVSAGGVEEDAAPLVEAVVAAGASAVAVAGASADHRLAVACARAGAREVFALPADAEVLRAWLSGRIDAARGRLRAEARARADRSAYDFSNILGESPDLQAALERAARIIPRPDTTVLITGETGTGKELLAHAIHANGPRAAQPFVEVNCTALPATLLESELFGHEKGAFTDARAAKPGLFEAAHGGTLFLDEIGDLSPELQVKLLKVLEDRRVRRLGSVRAIDVDLRIIAATHVDLPAAIRHGRFREDLYYRLSVLPIELPPLRARGDDVLLLAEHFLSTFAAVYDVPHAGLTPELKTAILAHSWPGNVRELRNAVERAVLLCDRVLRVDDLFVNRTPPPTVVGEHALPFPAPLDDIERAAARLMLELADGNKSLAADRLGISRSRLYRLLDEP